MLKESGQGYQRFLLYSEWGCQAGRVRNNRRAGEPLTLGPMISSQEGLGAVLTREVLRIWDFDGPGPALLFQIAHHTLLRSV